MLFSKRCDVVWTVCVSRHGVWQDCLMNFIHMPQDLSTCLSRSAPLSRDALRRLRLPALRTDRPDFPCSAPTAPITDALSRLPTPRSDLPRSDRFPARRTLSRAYVVCSQTCMFTPFIFPSFIFASLFMFRHICWMHTPLPPLLGLSCRSGHTDLSPFILTPYNLRLHSLFPLQDLFALGD